MPPQTHGASGATEASATHFKAGTLTYTKFGLVALFAWLLWGDVCYQLHEIVVQSVLPLAFKRNGAPNWLLGLLMTSVPAALNFTLNPIISTASDRTRTRWGRRKPYLLLSAPINAMVLILLAFSEDIGRAAHGGVLGRLLNLSPGGTIVVVIAFCFIFFRLTDGFVGTTYYYLFSDVVPPQMMSRFMALFRVVGMLCAVIFNLFFFKYAETHMRWIFLGAGLLYLVGYTLMCLKIKEGEYPPPPVHVKRYRGIVGLVHGYFKECFSSRFYWYFFLFNALWNLANACAPFGIFMERDSLGITLKQIGLIRAATQIVSMLVLFFAGILADRWHPLRFMLLAMFLQAVFSITSLNWLFWNPTSSQAWHLLVFLYMIAVPLEAMRFAATFPMTVRLLPKEHFGQFAAANAMVVSLAGMFSGAVAGKFLDIMVSLHGGSAFGYRYMAVWNQVFIWMAVFMVYRLYKEWVRLGGISHFTPPPVGHVTKPIPVKTTQAKPPSALEIAKDYANNEPDS